MTVLVTAVPGKRHALRAGGRPRRTPLVALVDSDTSWAPDAARRLRMPFADPTVGGDRGAAERRRPQRAAAAGERHVPRLRYFDELAGQTVAGRSVSCLSGRTAVYRRSILERVADAFLAETFLGVPCMSGDDKRLTSLTATLGYATVLQRSARVWSTFPGTPAHLRPAAGAVGSQHLAVGPARAVPRPVGVAPAVPRVLHGRQGRRRLHAARRAGLPRVALVHGDLAFAAALLGWWWVSRAPQILPHLRRGPRRCCSCPRSSPSPS